MKQELLNHFQYLKAKNDFAKAMKGVAISSEEKILKLKRELQEAHAFSNQVFTDLKKQVADARKEHEEVILYYKTLKDIDWWSQGYEKGYEVALREAGKGAT